MMNRLFGTRLRLFVGLALAGLAMVDLLPACAQGSTTFAVEQPHKSKKQLRQERAADKSSVAPAFSIPVEPLGFTPPGPLYLGQRNSLVSLDFLGEDRLLFTFRVPGLIHRHDVDPEDGDIRQIRAVVLRLPGGAIESEAVWAVHDRLRYLWMLRDGHFLLRDRDGLQMGDSRLELKPFLHFPGPLLSLEMDPAQQYMVTNSREPALTAQKSSDVSSPSTAAATMTFDGPKPDAQNATGQQAAAESDMVVRILRRETGQVMLVSRVRSAVHLPINAEGYLESIRSNGSQWLVNLNFFTGGSRIIGRVESACTPIFEFVSQQEAVATICDRSGVRKLTGLTTDGRRLWEALPPPQPAWPLLVMGPDGSHLVRETLAVNHPISTMDPLDSEDIKAQMVEVLNAADGQVVLKVTASPVLDAGGNVALSPSGRKVAVLSGGAIKVFELPEPPPLPGPAR